MFLSNNLYKVGGVWDVMGKGKGWRYTSIALLVAGLLSLGTCTHLVTTPLKKETSNVAKEHNSLSNILTGLKSDKEAFYSSYVVDTSYANFDGNYNQVILDIEEYKKIRLKNSCSALEELTALDKAIETTEAKLDSIENLQEYKDFKKKLGIRGTFYALLGIGGILGIAGSASIAYNRLNIFRKNKNDN